MPATPTRRRWIHRMVAAAVILLVLGIPVVSVVWWKFLASEEQAFATDADRFAYGSLGGELLAGIPYPIFMILPRVFPDLVQRYATEGYGPDKPGYGGYGAFGLAWEQGARLPMGLSVKRLGFDRVTVNCALCHTATYRLSEDEDRHIVPGGPGHTVDVQGLLRFLFAVSHDRRFTAARLLPEMALHVPLDWLDWPLYALVLIPKMRLALRIAEAELGFMDSRTAWGPGRDDAFNLPKFILLQQHWDNSVSNTDFPALWQLGERDNQLVHAAGEAHSIYAVSATSALGTGALPGAAFRTHNEWIVSYLRNLPAPAFPAPVDAGLAAQGGAIFASHCAACHAPGGARTGTAIPLAEIGTDPEHVRAWTQRDADSMNRLTGVLGVTDATLQGAQGYVARPLVGVWLLSPYLHNGSVPTLADLLAPPTQRPAVFFRAYDVLDRQRVGFDATSEAAQRQGFRFDTVLKGNSQAGHLYGTDLAEPDKRALIEYLKTL